MCRDLLCFKHLLLYLVLSSFCFSGVLSAQVPEQEAGKVFVNIVPTMESALELVDEQKELPESSWFRSDKGSKQEDINELLDQAIEALDLEGVSQYRQQLSDAKSKIKAGQGRIAEYRRLKLAAPSERTLGLDRLPYFVTREGYDLKIEEEEAELRRYEEIIKTTKSDFQKRLKELGVKMSEQEFEVLLNTVNGEDFIDMKVAFETIKGMTLQLEKLTAEAGEDVHTAKKYFGLFTVQLRILDRIQRKFVEDIHAEHIPKLKEYAKSANKNIAEAESAIERGGNRIILEQNINSNKLTLQALGLYQEYLQMQEETIKELNASLQKEIDTADNTYNTVALATKVVDLLRTGMKNFETLLRLEAPSIAGFENQDMREEIIKLTGLMQSDN